MSEYSCLSSFWCWSEWFFGQRILNVITMLSRKCMSPERLSSSFWTPRSIFFVSALVKCSIDEISSMDAFHLTDDDFECHTLQAVSRCVSYIVSLEKRFSLIRLLSLYENYCVVSSKSYHFGKCRRKTTTRIRELKCQQKKKRDNLLCVNSNDICLLLNVVVKSQDRWSSEREMSSKVRYLSFLTFFIFFIGSLISRLISFVINSTWLQWYKCSRIRFLLRRFLYVFWHFVSQYSLLIQIQITFVLSSSQKIPEMNEWCHRLAIKFRRVFFTVLWHW